MKSRDSARRALSMCVAAVAAVLLVACDGGTSQAPVNPSALAVHSVEHGAQPSAPFKVLYRFIAARHGRRPGGAFPYAPLIAVNGLMYGTTYEGGVGGTLCQRRGCGTVYSIGPTGAKRVIYQFRGGSNDGANPTEGLIEINGTLYGTTADGGGSGCARIGYVSGCGTVYSISPNGTESVLHKFTGPPDGAGPDAAPIEVNGLLYGTTSAGGTVNAKECLNQVGCGTVYSISTSGSEKVLYAFRSFKDGYNPTGLVNASGTLYGTTFYGGASCNTAQGCGTIYSIGSDGSKKTLHVFRDDSGGSGPNAALIIVKGMLYGTTGYGGNSQGIGCAPFGCGTVFSTTFKGVTKILYAFAGGSGDGYLPKGLIYLKDSFYGTTWGGGAGCSTTCGIVYRISSAGQESVLHNFTGPDGAFPHSRLLALKGTLYGTTDYGGGQTGGNGCDHNGDCGTVFALSP